MQDLIPVSIVTGFLGSGKTTLISRILQDPAFARTAVVVNEFGEVGIDHDLIASSNDTILSLATGCFCCAIQSDLTQTMLQLLGQRASGSILYDRVLIETSGLGDPAPMLQTMIQNADIASTHLVPQVVTIVDSVHGEHTLHTHPEAKSQVRIADRLLLSKTDLQKPSSGLLALVRRLNDRASCTHAARFQPEWWFQRSSFAQASAVSRDVNGISISRPKASSFVLVRDKPIPAVALTLLLQGIAEHCGHRLLRLKGIAAIEEMAEHPAVIHGVRHVIAEPEFLDKWPSEDTNTRIVFIVDGVPQHFMSRLLDVIEAEMYEISL